MLQSRIILCALLALAGPFGCSRLHVSVQDQVLRCGIAAPENSRLIEIIPLPDTDARLVRQGEVKSVAQSPKGCLILSSADQDATLIVRSKVDGSLGLMTAVKELPQGFSSLPLKQNSSLVQSSRSAHCVGKDLQLKGAFSFALSQSTEQHAQYPLVEIRVRDAADKILQQNILPVDDQLALPLDLPDGRYTFELTNFDAFAAQRPAGERCSVVIDTEAPEITFEQTSATPLQVTPGKKLYFATKDKNPVQNLVCMVRRLEEDVPAPSCDPKNFQPLVDGLTVPDAGMWDVSYYARDEAGNASATHALTLAVYHKDLIGQIQVLNTQVAELQKNSDDFRAFKTFQKLVRSARELVLREELRDVYWDLLGRFYSLAVNSHLLWQFNIETYGEKKQVIRSPEAEHSAVRFPQKLLIIDGDASRTIAETYLNIAYLEAKKIAAFRVGAFDIYQGLEKIQTIKLADELDVRMASDYQKKLLFFMNDKARLTVYSDFTDFSVAQNVKFFRPFGMESRTPQGLRKFIPFSWVDNPEFISSPEEEYVFLAMQNNLVRFSTRTWAWDVKMDADACQFTKIVVASQNEIYYLSKTSKDAWPTSCGLRKASWSHGFTPTILSTDVTDIATGPGTRLPFLAAYSEKQDAIDTYDFGSDAEPRRIFIYGKPLSHWALDIDPTQPNFVFGTDGEAVARMDLAVGRFTPQDAIQSFKLASPAATMIPLAGASQVLTLDTGLIKRFRVTADTAALFPEGTVCGTARCQGFPEQNLLIGFEAPRSTVHVIDSLTRKKWSYQTEWAIEASIPCGNQRVCLLDDRSRLILWNLATDQKTFRWDFSSFYGIPKLSYAPGIDRLTVTDAFDAQAKMQIIALNGTDPSRATEIHDASTTWVSEADGTIFHVNPQEILVMNPDTLEPTSIAVPADFEFWRMKNDKEVFMKRAGSIHSYDLRTHAIEKVSDLVYQGETFAGARIGAGFVTDRQGDSFKIDVSALTPIEDEFHLLVQYEVNQTQMVGHLHVNPLELERLLQKWPLAQIPETAAPIQAPSL